MASRPDELFLIDGNSLVYRAFFALPESIATSTGFPTNAIFGFASMLVKILTEHGTKPTVVVWDAGSSGRKEVYAEYKAGRAKRPTLLGEQWPHFEPLVEAFGYRNVHVDGFEADDVIASIAERAREADPPIPTVIVTGDRDAFQLIDPDGIVKVMATSRGITETKMYDHEAVVERYGIPPELIPDFYGLKGDTSDNIPGVPGIGDKTASQLLQQWGDLEGVLSHIDDISGAKRKQNLTENADLARVSKELATIRRDIPVDVDVTAEASTAPDRSRLRDVFREFELRDPLRRLEEVLGEDEAAPATACRPPRSAPRSAGHAHRPQRAAAGGADARRRATGGPGGRAVRRRRPVALRRACDEVVLTGEAGGPADVVRAVGDRPVVAHDAKSLDEVPPKLVHDTLLGAYLLEPARRGYPFRELVEERGLAADIEDPVARDAVLTAALADWQREQLADRELQGLMDDIELPLVGILRDMERAGRAARRRAPRRDHRARAGEIRTLEAEVWDLAGTEFVLGSPQQLGEILFEKLGLSRKRRGKTGFSTDARVLQAIRDEHEIIPKIERWRELNQLDKTYFSVLPQLTDAEGRIHTTFLQAVAITGRLASTNPNMQNVPIRTELGQEIRGCFEAAPGNVLLSADYSQIELRVLAHIADEPVLKEIFVKGEDVHTATASQVFRTPPDQLDRRPALPGEDDQLRHRLRPERLRPGGPPRHPARGGQGDHRRLPRPLPRGAGLHRGDDREGHRGRLRHDPLGPPAADPRAQGAQLGRPHAGRAPGGQQPDPGHRRRRPQARDGPAHEVVRDTPVRQILTVHDELLFEGPPDAVEAVRDDIVAAMVGVWDHEPPLVVDVGVGRTWLDAK